MEHRILNGITVTRSVLAIYVAPGAGEKHHPNRPSHGLAFVRKGTAVYLFEGKNRVIQREGELIYFPKGSNYVVEKSADAGIYAVNFDIAEPICAEPFVCRFRDPQAILRLFEAAVRQYDRRRDSDYFVRGTVYQLLYAIRTEQDAYLSKSTAGILTPAVDALRGSVADPLSVPELARMCRISETYFRRLFRKTFGTSPVAYRNRLRFEHALRLLRSGEYTVHAVAELTGFPDDSSFSRFFKKMSGKSPSGEIGAGDAACE